MKTVGVRILFKCIKNIWCNPLTPLTLIIILRHVYLSVCVCSRDNLRHPARNELSIIFAVGINSVDMYVITLIKYLSSSLIRMSFK